MSLEQLTRSPSAHIADLDYGKCSIYNQFIMRNKRKIFFVNNFFFLVKYVDIMKMINSQNYVILYYNEENI